MRKLTTPSVRFAIVIFFATWLCSCGPSAEFDPWDLIPRKSFAVWEVTDLKTIDSVFYLDGHSYFETLLKAPQVDSATKGPLLKAYQLLGDKTESLTVFDLTWLNQDSLQKSTKKKRIYEGRQVIDFTLGGKLLTFTSFERFGVVSTHSLMVEEAIRQYKTDQPSFKDENANSFAVPNLKKDAGNLYVNGPEFSKVLRQNGFFSNDIPLVSQLMGSAVFDFEINNQTFLFSGFGVDSSGGKPSLLSLFASQRPVPIQLIDLAPDQFDFLLHIGLTNPKLWNEQRLAYLRNDTLLKAEILKLNDRYSFDIREFWSVIDDEILKITRDQNEILFVEIKERSKASALFDRLRKAFGAKSAPEIYSHYALEEIELPNVGYSLFSPLFGQRERTHFTFAENLLLISNSEKFLKDILKSIDQESTVGKSLAWRKFLSNTQQESNLSVLVGNRYSLANRLPFDKISIQFTRLDKNFYASSFLSRSISGDRKPTETASAGGDYSGEGIPRNDLYPMTNHNTGLTELLFQDEANRLVLLDSENRFLWTKQLNGEIQSGVYQIDYLKNNKLQYLLATSTHLYVIDRLGKDVTGFPLNLKLDDARFLYLVDYNNTKDYRFLIGTQTGKIFLFDKKGNLLDGWNPKITNEEFASSPRHFRIKKKDYFGLMSEKGSIYLFNRRGERIDGFPFDSRLKPSGDFYTGSENVVFVSEDGRLLAVDTKGQIRNDEVLPKNDLNAKFGLCVNQDRSNFVIYRKERGQLGFFDSGGKILFEIPNAASEKIEVRLHTFVNDRTIILVYDDEQHLFYLIDGRGKLVTNQPIETSTLPGISSSKNNDRVVIYFSVEKVVKRISFPL